MEMSFFWKDKLELSYLGAKKKFLRWLIWEEKNTLGGTTWVLRWIFTKEENKLFPMYFKSSVFVFRVGVKSV